MIRKDRADNFRLSFCVDKYGKKWYNRTMERSENPKKFNIDWKALWKKADGFFDKNYALFFAPIFVFVLYVVTLFSQGVYPFGDKYTVASYDLSAQICPFIEHLFDVMQGKSTLNYSYAIVGGADVTGTFLYFFISPFSFLFLVFGDGKVLYAASIVMIFKLMTIAFAGTWFAKKMFQNIPDYICIAVGVVYAYCGYTFVSNTYINWMDFLIYMPFAAAAFRHFVKTGKFLPFSILMACCIYTCFSIACFSMFTVFPALVVYGLLCVKKEDRNHFIAYLCLSFVVTILLALPVLVPALFAFLSSARGGDLFENLWYGYTMVEGEITDFNSSTFFDKWSTSLYRKWTYILSDSIFVTLTILWFIRKGLKDKFAQFMLVAGIMTLLPLVVDEAMNLMNMGSYMSYALRFGFLNALYFLGGACLAIEDLCAKYGLRPVAQAASLPTSQTETEGVETPLEMQNEGGMSALNVKKPLVRMSTKKMIWTSVFVFLGVLAIIGIAWIGLGGGYKTIWRWFTDDKDILNGLNSFAGRFAHSLGGLEVIMFLAPVVLVLTTFGVILLCRRRVNPRVVAIVLTVVVGVQVVFYNNQLVLGNRSTQHETAQDYQNMAAVLNEMDDSYFRVKDYDDKWTSPIPLTGNTNAFSVFSSVIDADNFVTYQLFGYKGNPQNNFKSAHNTGKSNRSDEFGDSFLGYKYFFKYTDPDSSKTVEEQLAQLEKNKPYIKKVTITNAQGEEEHLHSGNFYVYENTIVFPSAYRVDGGDYKFERPNVNNSTNRRINQAKLYEFLRGENLEEFTGSKYVTPKSATELSEYLWSKAAEIEVSAGKIKATVTGAKEGEALFLNFVASKGYMVTVNGKKAELIDNDLKFLSVALEEGDNVVEFTYSSPYVKYMAAGLGVALVGLLAVWFVVQKTRFMQYVAKYISWAGILLAAVVVGFFMVFPTCVFFMKLLALIP